MQTDWLQFKQFAVKFYNNVEIVSVNPYSLKGYFNDVYYEK